MNGHKNKLFGILASPNRLAGYSSFLTEDYNKDLEVHSVALVHPNFCFAKTSLNRDVSFNSGFALQARFATENSDVVIFVKIIKENLMKCFAFHLTKF